MGEAMIISRWTEKKDTDRLCCWCIGLVAVVVGTLEALQWAGVVL
jgi:cytochrome c oxidase assembly factor CtaG